MEYNKALSQHDVLLDSL